MQAREEEMNRVVVDTNVLVSAMISLSGNEALLLLAVKQGFMTPCFSPAVLEEYSEVLARPKFGFSPDEIAALSDLLQRRGDLVRSSPLSDRTPRMTSSSPAPWWHRQISLSRATSRISRKINLEARKS
jgi:predicted nucleic acid-binding protein